MSMRLLWVPAMVVACLGASRSDVATLAIAGHANATPWIAASGSTVAVAWGAAADGKADVFVAMSEDGGRAFGEPVRVNSVAGEARLGGELPPRVAVRRREGRPPEVVVLWTARGASTEIKVARSIDGGRSFSAAASLESDDAAGDRGWPALHLDQSGTAHAIWLDHRGLAAQKGDAHAAHKSAAGDYDGSAMAQKSGLYYAAAGTTPAPERELTPGVCYCCKTALAATPDGALIAAWRHVFSGNFRDIAFTISRDGGRTFSPPARVSEDRWQLNGCPDDGPAIATDRDGGTHILWPTVLPEPVPQGALFYAYSRDGRGFSPRLRVPTLGSPKPSHPQIAAGPHDRLVVAWDEVIDGVRVAAVRTLTPAANGPQFGDIVRLDTGASSYPVLATADDGVLAAWTSGTGAAAMVRVRRLSF